MSGLDPALTYKVFLIVVLAGFLPLTAWSYLGFRGEIRQNEIRSTLRRLGRDPDEYEGLYASDISTYHYALAVGFASLVSLGGLAALFLGTELDFAGPNNLLLGGSRFWSLGGAAAPAGELDIRSYQKGALLSFSMAFIGAYVWGVGSLMRRYTMNDLRPSAYLNLGVRMILSGFIALLFYHGMTFLLDVQKGTHQIIPALAFFIGIFPERGIAWIQEKIPVFARTKDPTVREMPLEMIEGVTLFDKLRLSEVGIDTCYDLATAEFERLLLKTPYQPREIIDWILQAKLCVSFGPMVKELRILGIRTVIDLQNVDAETITELCKESPLTEARLKRIVRASKRDPGVARLKEAREILAEDPLEPEPEEPEESEDEKKHGDESGEKSAKLAEAS